MKKFLLILLVLNILTTLQAKRFPLGSTCTIESERLNCGRSLFCNATQVNTIGACIGCYSSIQCRNEKRYSYDCMNYKTTDGKISSACIHKNLFPRITEFDILASIFTFLGGIMASASGAGGGGIFVPMFTSIGQFPPKMAIPLSKAMIFGGSIANFLILSQIRHPRANRPLIQYNLALLFEPVTLLGTIIGVFLNVMFPDWMVYLLLLILLGVTTIRLIGKGTRAFRKEAKELRDQKSGKKDELLFESTLTEEQQESGPSDELKAILKDEASTPWDKFVIIGICWIVVFTLAVIKGGHGTQSPLEVVSCSWIYWGVVLLNFPIVLSIVVLCAIWIYAGYKKKMKLGYKLMEGDIAWTIKNLIVYPLLCGFAGVMAGLLGIGGGMVKGPLLLEMGVLPEVAAATSSFMILFTSSITTAQYTILGRLPYDYGIFFATLGFFAGLFGQVGMDFVVKKLKRASILIFSLAVVIGSSTILMFGVGVAKVYREYDEGAYMGFHAPC